MDQTDRRARTRAPIGCSRADAYPHTLELRLTDAERDALERVARERGVFPDTVLYLYVNDLTRKAA